VDPAIQRQALDRATQLLLQICGGQAGPVTHAGVQKPPSIRVQLRYRRLLALLGYEVSSSWPSSCCVGSASRRRPNRRACGPAPSRAIATIFGWKWI